MVTLKDIYYRPVLDQVMISVDGVACQILHEGKWIRGSFDRNIRIDQPTHGRGQTHAHILGRKGDEIGVVNIDGSGSHGTKFQLKDGDADALRASGFIIRDDNVVEWVAVEGDQPKLLLG